MHTKSQNLIVSRLILQLSLPNPLKPDVESRMKMWLEQRRQAMLQLHLSDQQFYRLGVAYIRALTVMQKKAPYTSPSQVSYRMSIVGVGAEKWTCFNDTVLYLEKK